MKNLFNKIITSRWGAILLLIVLLVINFVASIVHSRIDLTKEKRYTLSKATRNLLVGLDDDVQIDVFLKGDFPAGFRKLANSTRRIFAAAERQERIEDPLQVYFTAGFNAN
jgi:ABC-type uncharacterized transport system involved in gliding motility auxiliary subunit